jgi:hypothetical protein
MLAAVITAATRAPRWRSALRPLNLAFTAAFGIGVLALLHFGKHWSWASAAVAGAGVVGVFVLQDLLKAVWYANEHE